MNINLDCIARPIVLMQYSQLMANKSGIKETQKQRTV